MKKFILFLYLIPCIATEDVTVNTTFTGNTSQMVIQIFSVPQLQNLSKKIKDHLKGYNKTKIGLYTAGISYAASISYVLYSRYTIYNSNSWCNWLENIPFNKLVQIPQKELFTTLSNEIANRYDTPPTTITMHLTDFLKETNNELTILRKYINIGSFLQNVHLHPLIFITASSIKDAKCRIKRLVYLRTILAQNLEPNNVMHQLNFINASGK